MLVREDAYLPLASNNGCLEELNDILLEYERYFKSDPQRLRHQIPTEEMWRFFVDGCQQSRFWLSVEARENGYFKAMFTAFNEIFSPDQASNKYV